MSARPHLAEFVYAELKSQMHDFRLLPGDRFSEAEIGQRLGVSRTPVREALLRLRTEGLLEVEAKSGWFVRPIDFTRVDQLYDLRILLEQASVARLAAAAELPAPVEALERVWLAPAAERPDDAAEVGRLDEVFHATLVRAAGNEEIARVHWDLTERIRFVRRLDFTRSERVEATYQEHAKILRQVRRRRSDGAQQLLAAHIEQSKAAVRRITLATVHEARRRAPAATA